MTARARQTCARCRRLRPMQARGLCHPCHKHEVMAGTIDNYATRSDLLVDRNARIVAELQAGGAVGDVAALLGLTYDTVRSVARTHGLIGGNPGVPLAWLTPVAPAPTTPPCVGRTMDFDGFKPAELHPTRNAAVRSALALCATCPLATRQWCLDTVDPRGIGKEWQGIAGGVVWSNGRLVYMPIEAEEAAS